MEHQLLGYVTLWNGSKQLNSVERMQFNHKNTPPYQLLLLISQLIQLTHQSQNTNQANSQDEATTNEKTENCIFSLLSTGDNLTSLVGLKGRQNFFVLQFYMTPFFF